MILVISLFSLSSCHEGMEIEEDNEFDKSEKNFVDSKRKILTHLKGKLNLVGDVSTIAGSVYVYGHKDDYGVDASFAIPSGVATDGKYLYIADQGNQNIRKLNLASGEVTTIAGKFGKTGFTNGIGDNARFNHPWELATDGDFLYVADRGNSTIRKINLATNEVSTLAGKAGVSGSNDGAGIDARFYSPTGLTIIKDNLYVTDRGNHTIRKIDLNTNVVSTIAGRAGYVGSKDGAGVQARFLNPLGITTDGQSLYVSDHGNDTIRKITLDKFEVSTLLDSFDNKVLFNNPMGLATDGESLYITDSASHTIKIVSINSGEVQTLAGVTSYSGSEDGNGHDATFSVPRAITSDGERLYVVGNNNHTIRMIE